VIDLQLEGSWRNTGRARFVAGVADSTLPGVQNPDDPNPFFELDGGIVSSVSFDSRAPVVFQGVPPIPVPVPDGGEPDGDVDLNLTLSFVPVPGRTYRVGARLAAFASGQEEAESADFESTARVVQVVVAPGVSFTSSANASWNVVVPEPPVSALLGLGALACARWRSRRRGIA
jgi:hypothetical protein